MSKKLKPPKYLYCVISDPNCSWRLIETRRYRVDRLCKQSVVMDRRYAIRQDDRWIEPDQPQIDDTFRAYGTGDSGIFFYADKQFVRRPSPEWPGRKLEPQPKPKPSFSWDHLFEELEDIRLTVGSIAIPDAFKYFGFQIPPTADEFAKAYRTASLRLHPDHGGDAMEFRTMQAKADKCREWFAVNGGGR